MLKCNGRIFMNLQEAVQWLLNNNALIFVCVENYAADTEIPLSSLVNPSPANPKIGSVVMFADGKISPITGLTDDSFTVGSNYIEPQTADIPLLESIVDKDGHNRFVEGPIELRDLQDLQLIYGKWSLSGTHLMVVLVLTATENTPEGWIADVNLPDWIKDKIQAFSENTWVDVREAEAFGADNTSLTVKFTTTKIGPGLRVFMYNPFDKERYVRFQLDLLIDDE